MNKLLAFITENANLMPDKVIYDFIEYTNGVYNYNGVTYKELFNASKRIAMFMTSLGIKKGDIVVVLSNNSKENVFSIYASMMIGAIFTLIPVPVDKNKEERFNSVVKSCNPRLVLTNTEAVSKIKNGIIDTALYKMLNVNEILEKAEEQNNDLVFEEYSANDDDIVYLQYSSGSTNEPKGVKVSLENLMANLNDLNDTFSIEKSSNLFSWVPFFHNIGLVGVVFDSLWAGRRAYLLPTENFMANPSGWLKLIGELKIELTVAPNSAYELCLKIISEEESSKYDLSSLNYILNGSEPISYDTLEAFSKRFGIDINTFVPCYGLAESVCFVSGAVGNVQKINLDYDSFRENKFVISSGELKSKEIVGSGNIGKSLEVAIINPDTGRLVDECEIGEVCLKGKSVALGYWNEPNVSSNFNYTIKGRDGEYLRTGDLGAYYNDNLFVIGRLKEMIIINGHNIYPDDIKELLKTNISGLASNVMCIFSVSIEHKERVIVCMEVDNNRSDCEMISNQIGQIMSENFDFSPHDVLFVQHNALPRTDNGKIRTNEVKQKFECNELNIIWSNRRNSKKTVCNINAKNEVDDEIKQKVREEFKKVLSIDEFGNTDSFLELGGDSFDMVELISNIEKAFNVSVDIKDILIEPSVNGISEFIKLTSCQ